MQKVKDLIMYQATTRDYKIGDILEFGQIRNFQAERVLNTNYRMEGAENGMPEMFLQEKLKKKKKKLKLTRDEAKSICDILFSYGFSMRELGYEICRQLYYKNEPSRLNCMFLCEKAEEAKCYLTTAKQKGNQNPPRVVGLKLNGKILRTSNSFNRRDGKSINEFITQAHDYWKGVDENFADTKSVEYLFEGTAEVVEILYD